MRYLRSRYFSSLKLFSEYSYPSPFHLFLKQFFRTHKKIGSKDRKAITDICYNYLRMGVTLRSFSLKEGLFVSLLTLEIDIHQDWLKLRDELELDIELDERENGGDISSIIGDFIYYEDGFLMEDFHHYNCPKNLYFRPNNWAKDHAVQEKGILGLPGAKEISFNQNLTSVIQVQDLSSQFLCSKIIIQENDNLWDVCSGAGGKSINLSSRKKGTFYLSDIRSTILKNAKSRMLKMHYDANYLEIDMGGYVDRLIFDNKEVSHGFFDTIIADVPCSGSGTWFRTPEHFMNFDYDSLVKYTNKQKSILENTLPFLKVGGMLYYLTCSVFDQENSGIKNWVMDNFSISLQNEIMFDGIRHRSDGMYMASFKKLA